jgi:hypothetical protein
VTYRDGYVYGQHDVLNWLGHGDDGDAPLAPIDEHVQPHAWSWCLSHSISIAGSLCRAFSLGVFAVCTALPARSVARVDSDMVWTPGCGRAAT